MASDLVCNEPGKSLDAPGLHVSCSLSDNLGGAQYSAGGWSAVAGSGFGNFGASSSSVDASNCKQAQIVAQDQSPYTAPPESSFTLYVFVRYVFVFVRSF